MKKNYILKSVLQVSQNEVEKTNFINKISKKSYFL